MGGHIDRFEYGIRKNDLTEFVLQSVIKQTLYNISQSASVP